MMKNVTRRDFLKLSSLIPFALSPLQRLRAINHQNSAGGDRNILILVFDALSARHMSLYGYPRNTTPNLARFAEHANVYHSHHAAGNFTTPGTASLLTGVYPWIHRAFLTHGTVLDLYKEKNIFSLFEGHGFSFAYTHNLLAESLLQQFQAHISHFIRTRELALSDLEYSDQVFPKDYNVSLWGEQLILRGGEARPSSLFGGLFYRFLRLSRARALADEFGRRYPYGVPNMEEVYFLLEDATDWLINKLPDIQEQFLGYFHVLPPHDPYCPRKDFTGIFQDQYTPSVKPTSPFTQDYTDEELNQNRLKYDEYIANADDEFGRLYDALAQDGLLENMIIFVTADHGEMFERGISGHTTPLLYEPLLHVPLIISRPEQSQRQDITTLTSCLDILPTIASLTGQDIPPWAGGRVLPGFDGYEEKSDRTVFALEAKSSPKFGPLKKATITAIRDQYKLIDYRGYPASPAMELFDLTNDPEELHNLASDQPSLVNELKQEINSAIGR